MLMIFSLLGACNKSTTTDDADDDETEESERSSRRRNDDDEDEDVAVTADPPDETPQQTSDIVVRNVDEFLAALAPDVTIVIPESGLLFVPDDWVPKGEQLSTDNEYYLVDYIFDEYEIIVRNITGLTIRGGGAAPAPLQCTSEGAYVLSFFNCVDLTIENISAGHLVLDQCYGGVFSFTDCSNVTLRNTEMYGCGTEGLYLVGVTGMIVTDCVIYECTTDLMSIEACRNIVFTNTEFRDSGWYYAIHILDSNGIMFNSCTFARNIVADPFALFSADTYSSNIIVRNSDFIDNEAIVLSSTDLIKFENCRFSGNNFDTMGFFDDNDSWFSYEPEIPGQLSTVEVASMLSGRWICRGFSLFGSDYIDPADAGVNAWLFIYDDGTVDFSVSDGDIEITANGKFTADYSHPNEWNDGSYVEWTAIVPSDDGAYHIGIMPYQHYLQAYICQGEYNDAVWLLSLYYELGE